MGNSRGRCWITRYATMMSIVIILGVISGCTQIQQTNLLRRWDSQENIVSTAFVLSSGILIYRLSSVNSELEVFDSKGELVARTQIEKSIVVFKEKNGIVYYIYETGPHTSTIWKWNLSDQPVQISDERNWVDIYLGNGDELYGIQSFYTSRDKLPSGVRIIDLVTNDVVLEDLTSFQYPLETNELFLLSPIDRKIRCFKNGKYEIIGSVNSLAYRPVVNREGTWFAWFGPHKSGSALYLSSLEGDARVFVEPMAERPLAWTGNDLLIADQDPLSLRWSLRRMEVHTAKIKSRIPVPANVTLVPFDGASSANLNRFVVSKTGNLVGFETDQGSLLLHVENGFVENYSGKALTSWHFSEDGRHLYFLNQHGLEVINF
ncbi:MAG: hypothetical protein JKX97_06990 [Candidatus Lindowbacteria bacterium]|nr:hypothetical protein [Candidatus Lindowbacteria bacterium]